MPNTSDDADLRAAAHRIGGLLEDLNEIRARRAIRKTALGDQHIGRAWSESG